MLDIKGTKTEENLKKAFAGESEARNKYTFFAEQARKDGFMQKANMFENIAGNEREHANMWYRLLHGGIGTTEENLQSPLQGEQLEADEMYMDFARVAREEGLDEIAEMFEGVAGIEEGNNKIFERLLSNIRNGEVFRRNGEEKWGCMVCGYTQTSKEAPEICPICGYGKEFFKISEENF